MTEKATMQYTVMFALPGVENGKVGWIRIPAGHCTKYEDAIAHLKNLTKGEQWEEKKISVATMRVITNCTNFDRVNIAVNNETHCVGYIVIDVL